MNFQSARIRHLNSRNRWINSFFLVRRFTFWIFFMNYCHSLFEVRTYSDKILNYSTPTVQGYKENIRRKILSVRENPYCERVVFFYCLVTLGSLSCLLVLFFYCSSLNHLIANSNASHIRTYISNGLERDYEEKINKM